MTTTKRKHEDEAEDLLRFIERGAHKTGKSVEIPSPEGMTQAGWVALQALKVQPEAHTMLEQLREHRLFSGKWKTSAQVAWSMIYLGLQSCYQFIDDPSDNWRQFKSNFLAYQIALLEKSAEAKQQALLGATKVFRRSVHTQLDKVTAFGRYKAWRSLEKAISTRDVVEDVKSYDIAMRSLAAVELNANMVFDNRAGEYWALLFPVIGGPLDEHAADGIYTDLTTAYFDELEAANAKREEE